MVGDSTVVVAWVGSGGGSAGGGGGTGCLGVHSSVRASQSSHCGGCHRATISQRCGLGLELDGKLMYDGYSM